MDLKYHDIPHTVGNACSEAAKLGVDMLTIHLAGGSDMIKQACSSVKTIKEKYHHSCLILGVSLLSSIDETMLNQEMNVSISLEKYFLNLAKLGVDNGIDGFIASPLEIKILKENFPTHPVVTPGIRLLGRRDNKNPARKDDQKRIASPTEAFHLGADYIVMGRSLLRHTEDPLITLKSILDSIHK